MQARHEHDDTATRRSVQQSSMQQSSMQRSSAEGSRIAPNPASTASALLALQRRVGNAAVAELIAQRSVRRTLASAGTPLPAQIRDEMQDRLGTDFSDVRVHTDAAADESARSVDAVAFTSGSHIVFRRNSFDPGSAGGKHLLAHELTHVMQQRSGPVSGTDRGDGVRVSDPMDVHERAAEASADRAMRTGPPPAQRAVDLPRPGASTTVQRWAFVGNNKINADTADLTPEMRKLAGDELVHDYRTMGEFESHAAGQTDYLGNLPGPVSRGTWVRFSPTGINIIGENHTRVTLIDVLTAVGSRSFIYEGFVAEGLGDKPATQGAYEEVTKPHLARFGIGDWSAHGAESLYPKLGEAMGLLLPYLKDQKDMADLSSAGDAQHLGRQLLRYLKIAWQYGKDMRHEAANQAQVDLAAKYEAAKHPSASMMQKLATTSLNDFIKKLPAEGLLGDAFADEKARTRYATPLAEFVTALIAELWQRERDRHPTFQPGNLPLTAADKAGQLANRRNVHLAAAVATALTNRVRYAGMGRNHSDILQQMQVANANWHFYDMEFTDLRAFEARTRLLEHQARTQPAQP